MQEHTQFVCKRCGTRDYCSNCEWGPPHDHPYCYRCLSLFDKKRFLVERSETVRLAEEYWI